MKLSALGPPRVVGRVPFRAASHAHLDVSPDGRYVALLSTNVVELFDQRGERLAQLHRHDVRGCGCFLDDERLLVGRLDGSLLVLDVAALALAGTLRDADALALGVGYPCAAAPIGLVARSPDGATLAVACGEPCKHQRPDKAVRLFDARTLAPGVVLKGMRRRAVALAFSPDGRRLAVAGDVTVRLYELAKGKSLAALGDADDAGLAWCPDGALLTLGQTHGLRRWNPSDRTITAQTPYPQQTLCDPRVAPDGTVIVVAGGAYLPTIVHRLDAALAPIAEQRFDRLSPWPDQPRITPDGTVWIAAGFARRQLQGAALTPVPIGDGHVASVTHFAVHPDGRWAATGDVDGNVRVWDLDAGRVVYAFPPETRVIAGELVARCEVRFLAFADRAPWVFLITERGGLRSFDAATGAPGWSLAPEAFAFPTTIFASPEGDAVLAFHSTKGGAHLDVSLVDAMGVARWSTTTDLHPRAVHWDDEALVLVDVHGSARLRRVDGALTDRWMLPTTSVVWNPNALRLSHDGALAAAYDSVGHLLTWRVERAEVLCATRPNQHGIRRLTGLHWGTGDALLTVDGDLRVEARDPATLEVRDRLDLAQPVRWTVHAARDGRRLVAPTHESTWLIYDLD